MKKNEIIGYKRANLGKKDAQALRNETLVPCVLYGGADQVHFSVPAILFRELLHTPDIYEVSINVEGSLYKAILQATQFHPVNDTLLHADFLEIVPGKALRVEVPIKLEGTAVGQQKGGKLSQKVLKLRLQGAASDIPDYVHVNIASLDLGKSVKVGSVSVPNCTILTSPNIPIASIEIPRALRGQLKA